MDHHPYQKPHNLSRHFCVVDQYNSPEVNLHSHLTSPRTVLSQGIHRGEIQHDNSNRSLGTGLFSMKRQREHHVIIAASRDEDYDENHHDDDNSMMDCYEDNIIGQSKRRRCSYTFPFDKNGQIIQIQQKQEEINHDALDTTVIEECTAMNISGDDKGMASVEWWRRKRPNARTASSIASAAASKSSVELEASSSCSAMDTSGGDNEICCHICHKSFPIPVTPSVRQVMPANALLNYFSPLNKKATSSGDVAMVTNDSHHSRASSQQNWVNSPACCRCCDRPSCPECRRHCEACQRSFCSFCSIVRDGAKSNSSFCLDCYDQFR